MGGWATAVLLSICCGVAGRHPAFRTECSALPLPFSPFRWCGHLVTPSGSIWVG
jgi:hypothetical protein|eukprot:COSAG01_NODE_4779_length_4745_cov_14.712043_3_plen_54_part_00